VCRITRVRLSYNEFARAEEPRQLVELQMRDARYLRAQAEFRLRMAEQISDHAACEKLRAEAARYHAEAADIESDLKTSPPPTQT
jgi:hypothetical protein